MAPSARASSRKPGCDQGGMEEGCSPLPSPIKACEGRFRLQPSFQRGRKRIVCACARDAAIVTVAGMWLELLPTVSLEQGTHRYPAPPPRPPPTRAHCSTHSHAYELKPVPVCAHPRNNARCSESPRDKQLGHPLARRNPPALTRSLAPCTQYPGRDFGLCSWHA